MASPTLQFKRGLFVNLPALRAGEPGFTTDRNDLYIGIGAGTTASNKFYGSSRYWKREVASTSAAELKLVDAAGDNGVSLRSPVNAGAGVTYTLPVSGSTGHYLKLGTDGALEWASVSEGGSFTNATLTNTTFSGISTFSGAIDANAGLDVTGQTTLNSGLDVTSGVSTFAGLIDGNGGANITGGSTFDNINVTGVGTIATADINGGNIDGTVIGGSTAAAGTFTQLNYSNSSTSGVSTVGSLYVGATKVLSTEGGLVALSGIATLDATTKATLEATLKLDPNDFDTLNVSGISTIGGFLDANGGADILGQTDLDTVAVSGVSTFTGAINANGGVVGNVTGNVTGNAGTATSLATARNFEISGDVVATAVSFDGTGNVNLVATIQPNSVGLGSDTTGNYVATVAGTANQISVSGSGSETAAVVLSLPDDVVVGTSLSVPTVKTATIQHSNGTNALTIDASGNVGVSTNLTITGNLTVNGSTTTVETETLLVKDSLIEVGLVDNGSGGLVAPSSDANIDVGMVFHYYSGSAKKAAVYWDDSEGRIAFGSDVTESNSVLSATAYATILAGGLEINNACTGGTDTVISCVGDELALSNIVVDGGTF